MRRILIAAAAFAGLLLAPSGAQAKAPPDGVQICGATEACAQLSWEDVEGLPALWASSYEGAAPAPASPFYLVRWHWPDGPENTRYYVPLRNKVWYVDEAGAGKWGDLPGGNVAALRTKSAGLEPFAVPTIQSVTVGGRIARDPQSYISLFGRGHQWWPLNQQRRLRIRIRADAPSPWTDPASDVRVSRRGRYLWVDGTIFKIPLQLARLVRAGRSLR
jgi:hypothetical protein